MRLNEVHQKNPQFAWLERASGPEDIVGVRLAYIEPVEASIKSHIEDARSKKDDKRAERLELRLQNYLNQGQKYFTPDVGWWMSEESFHAGEGGFGGVTKGNIYQRYPNLQVFPTRKEAITAAEKAGII